MVYGHFVVRVTAAANEIHFIAEGPLPSVLQEVSLPIINNDECEGMYRDAGYIEHIPNIFICAGYKKGGKDSCEVKMHSYIASKNLLISPVEGIFQSLCFIGIT